MAIERDAVTGGRQRERLVTACSNRHVHTAPCNPRKVGLALCLVRIDWFGSRQLEALVFTFAQGSTLTHRCAIQRSLVPHCRSTLHSPQTLPFR